MVLWGGFLLFQTSLGLVVSPRCLEKKRKNNPTPIRVFVFFAPHQRKEINKK
jgi:hypothetical protein